MDHYGFLAVIPPVIAIALAIRTKQVFVSLFLGIWLGWLIINGGNILSGSMATIEALVDVFKDAGNTRTILFSALVGGLIAFVQRSGGVEGFIANITSLLERLEKKNNSNNKVIIQFLAWFIGVLIFVETSISVLTVGSLFRPLFDKLKISREKLAYIADSSSAPSSILIPFNAWGAYIMGLLMMQGFDNPFSMMFRVMPYNFYPFLVLITVLIVIFSQKDLGPMVKAERRIKEEGKLVSDNATPVVDTEITIMEAKPGIRHRSINMIIPIATMVIMMPVYLISTGWKATAELPVEASLGERLFTAISQGSGSAAVLYSVLTALLVSMIMYRSQKIMKTGEMVDLALKGIGSLVPLAILMMLAFAISNVCRALGTGVYVAEVSQEWLSPGLVPAIVFIVSSFIAFSTGTSWGTFAIMISVSVPMAQEMGVNIHLAVAAALGGGVFGDHCSPISDTTIIASMASATDHIDHVKTQLPYALLAGGVTVALYLILGNIM